MSGGFEFETILEFCELSVPRGRLNVLGFG